MKQHGYGNTVRAALLATTLLVAPAIAYATDIQPPPGILPGGSASTSTVQPPGTTKAQPLSNVMVFDWRYMGPNGCIPDGYLGSGATDNTACFSAMASKAATDYTATGNHDMFRDSVGGVYATSGGMVNSRYVATALEGAGRDKTFVFPNSSFTGDFFSCDDAYGGTQVNAANTSLGSFSTYRSGCDLGSMTVSGSTLFGWNLFMMYDNTDHWYIHDVSGLYINGCGLCVGLVNFAVSAASREEGIIQNVDLNVVGSSSITLSATGLLAPAVGFYSTCTTGNCGGTGVTNHIESSNLRIYVPAADAIQWCNQITGGGMHDFGFQTTLIDGVGTNVGYGVHVDNSASTCAGAATYSVDFSILHVGVPAANYAAVFFDGNSSVETNANTSNHDIAIRGLDITKGGISSSAQDGIIINFAGANDVLQVTGNSVAGTELVVGSTMYGNVELDAGPGESTWTESISGSATGLIERVTLAKGSITSGDCVKFADTLHTIVDAGGPCVTASNEGSVTVTAAFSAGGGSITQANSGYCGASGNSETCYGSVSIDPTVLGTGVLDITISNVNAAATVDQPCMLANVGSITLPGSGTYLTAAIKEGHEYMYLEGAKSAVSATAISASNMITNTTVTFNYSCTFLTQ